MLCISFDHPYIFLGIFNTQDVMLSNEMHHLYVSKSTWFVVNFLEWQNKHITHSKKSIMNHDNLLASKLCIALGLSYVGHNSRSFMYHTAIQMILILHDSGVLCILHILDHELDHFSCPVLVHDSNVVFAHFHVVKCNALLSCKQITMMRYGFFTVQWGSVITWWCYVLDYISYGGHV